VNISQEDKERLLWDPSTGVFAGFKPRFGWKVRYQILPVDDLER